MKTVAWNWNVLQVTPDGQQRLVKAGEPVEMDDAEVEARLVQGHVTEITSAPAAKKQADQGGK